MTIYARNDVLSVGLSRSHGGCGHNHSRPVENGAAVKLWAFNECQPCENVLRSDPLWSTTISQLPETHDEQLTREDQEKRGQRDAAGATAQALTQLASLGDLPAIMAQLVTMFNQGDKAKFQLNDVGIKAASAAGFNCSNGHDVADGAKFCGECGTSVQHDRIIDVEDEASVVDLADTSIIVEDATVTDREFLEGLSFAELKDYARKLGVKTSNSRENQLNLVLAKLGA